MAEQFSQISEFIIGKWQEIDNYLLAYGLSLNKILLFLVLIWASYLLLRYVLRIKKRETFSLLLSKGEIRQGSDFDPLISLKVSNLNAFPVQVLELSIDSEEMSMPIVLELAELIAANDAISIELELERNLVGETGQVYLFAYLPKQAKKLYRLKADYSFEPWAGRYKISPLKQQIKRVRVLDSQKLNKSLNQPLNTKYHERSSSQIKAIEAARVNSRKTPKSPERLSHTEILRYGPKLNKAAEQAPAGPSPKSRSTVFAKPKQAEIPLEGEIQKAQKPKTKLKFPNEF